MSRFQLVLSDEQTGFLYLIDEGGGGRIDLPIRGLYPSWKGDDGRLIYVADDGGESAIWFSDDDGGNAWPIGAKGMSPAMPQMGRNEMIAFMGNPSAPQPTGASVWTMDRFGANLREVVPSGIQPSLAPSGAWMTYTRQTENPYYRQVCRINVDGTGDRQLTFFGDDPIQPDANASSISPDEQRIAMFSGQEAAEGTAGATQSIYTLGPRNVAVMPASGGRRLVLTGCTPVTSPEEIAALGEWGCFAADNPFWYPDGSLIGYDRAGQSIGVWNVDPNTGYGNSVLGYHRTAGARPMRMVP